MNLSGIGRFDYARRQVMRTGYHSCDSRTPNRAGGGAQSRSRRLACPPNRFLHPTQRHLFFVRQVYGRRSRQTGGSRSSRCFGRPVRRRYHCRPRTRPPRQGRPHRRRRVRRRALVGRGRRPVPYRNGGMPRRPTIAVATPQSAPRSGPRRESLMVRDSMSRKVSGPRHRAQG